jgi:hypothetical protein
MRQKTITSFKVVSAARKAPEHITPRHVVAALLDASGDTP